MLRICLVLIIISKICFCQDDYQLTFEERINFELNKFKLNSTHLIKTKKLPLSFNYRQKFYQNSNLPNFEKESLEYNIISSLYSKKFSIVEML